MKRENKILKINGYALPYVLQIKKVKHLSLRMESDGTLLVTCNEYVPIEKIEAFLIEKLRWILTKQKSAQERNNRFQTVKNGSCFYLMDQQLIVKCMEDKRNYVHFDQKYLYIHYVDEAGAKKAMQQFVKKQCELLLFPMIEFYLKQLEMYRIAMPSVKYRLMTSRWGSCMPGKYQITLNTRLLHCPKKFCEYVVLHELVHFIQPNHSDSFYRIIAYYMPDYKERMKLMK